MQSNRTSADVIFGKDRHIITLRYSDLFLMVNSGYCVLFKEVKVAEKNLGEFLS